MSEEAAKLASYGRRSFHRGDWSWKITDIRAVGNSLRIEAEASNGRETLVWRKDQPSPFEWMEVVRPVLRVPIGQEPNPNYDPEDPTSPEFIPAYQENYIEALKIEMDRFLERRLDA